MWTTPNHGRFMDDCSVGRRVSAGGAAMGGHVCRPEAVYLKPGGLYAGRPAARVTTVLGSCVAVTMYDPRSRAAAMCHAIQPVCPEASSGCHMKCAEKYKSVRCAVDEMTRRMKKMTAFHDDIEIKVFGGAALFESPDGRCRCKTVGQQNVEAARRHLAEYGFRIRVLQVGGGAGRKIIFDTSSGAVFLKWIKTTLPG